MDKKIITLFKKYRKNNKQSQKNAGLGVLSPSSYSRFESGEISIDADTMFSLLENFSITPEEFIIEMNIKSEKDSFEKLFFPPQKKELITIYYELQKKGSLTTKEMARYVAIKSTFGHSWNEIGQFKPKDINMVYDYLINRKNLSTYDYSIIRNMGLYFPIDDISHIVYRAFPLNEFQKKIPDILNYSTLFFVNIITRCLRKKDMKNTRKFVNFAKSEINTLKLSNSINWLEIHYLEALANFIEYGDLKEISKISLLVDFLRLIGKKDIANNIEIEVKEILSNDDLGYKNRRIE